MPLALLVFSLALGVVVTNMFAFGPLRLLSMVHIPHWLVLGMLSLAIAWIVGDD